MLIEYGPSRRNFIFATALGIVAYSGLTKARELKSLISIASTSNESRWYDFDDNLNSRLSDLNTDGWKDLSENEVNNRHLLDLRDISSMDQMRYINTIETLQQSEAWEISAERPELKNGLGYPSVVFGTTDQTDAAYYMFYAIHDPDSGIGLAKSDQILAKYRKIGEESIFSDSRVLIAPMRPRKTSHFSSPVVIWNKEKNIWHLYFHYYDNKFLEGKGHQRTALATSKNLLDWKILKGTDGAILSVLPTTLERWMNSQSSYHAIQRLPNGLWIAFLRGAGGEIRNGTYVQDGTKLGFAVSEDGVRWSLVPGAPQLIPARAPVKRSGILRPGFLALLRDGLEICWSESDNPDFNPRYSTAKTRDFKNFYPTKHPFSDLPAKDGAISPWRIGNRVYLFAGAQAHVFEISK